MTSDWFWLTDEQMALLQPYFPKIHGRNRIEIMLGRLKGWRQVATRYDRCPNAFFSAVALAATVIFWI